MVHAFDYLAKPQEYPLARGVCAVVGDEPLLKRLALSAIRKSLHASSREPTARAAQTDDEDELLFRTFDGETAQWRDVSDELCTASLFSAGPRLAIIEDADKFVTAHRGKLEDYAAQPAGGLLVLVLENLPGNQRLAKEVEKSGLAIECRVPASYRGKTKYVDERRVVKWLVERAKKEHSVKLETAAAEEMFELVGPELGLLDTELAKLVLFVEPGQSISTTLARDVVGGWRTNEIWDLMDAAAEGNAAIALTGLDKLLSRGESPQALFGQIAWSLRRFGDAVAVYDYFAAAGRRITIAQAFQEIGVQHYHVAKLEKQLQQIGRSRAVQIHNWLLQADLALKGSHSHAGRGRQVLEELIVRLASDAKNIPVSIYAEP